MTSFFVAALLYSKAQLSNKEEKELLETIIKRVKKDPILKNGLHLVVIDNDFSRDLLTYNTTNNKINIWPVFLIRKSTCHEARQYQLHEYKYVFDEVYKQHEKFKITNKR